MLPLDSVGYFIVVFNANAIRRSYAADVYGMVMGDGRHGSNFSFFMSFSRLSACDLNLNGCYTNLRINLRAQNFT